MGSIGDDKLGEVLVQSLKTNGMSGSLYRSKTLPTGVCAVLLSEQKRCLIPNLGAACEFPDEFLQREWVPLGRSIADRTRSRLLRTTIPRATF